MTKIEWCDEVWNPVTGCTKIHEGCKNCYAERIAHRFVRIGTHAIHGIENYDTMDFNDVLLHPDRLDKPLHWRKPRKIFVCSMGDLFHEDVPFKFIDDVFSVMIQVSHHKFIYTNNERYDGFPLCEMLNHIWLGVSVSTQKDADELIPILLQIPASKRIVSVEPMLSSIDLGLFGTCPKSWEKGYTAIYDHIDGIFCGCESGSGRRHIDIDCIRNLRDQCVDAGVSFFLKQMEINGKVVHMPEIDGTVWNQCP